MRKFDKITIYLCTFLTTCVMYSTQPLQPMFEQILGVSKFQASLFTTSILAPLAIASIVYGYILEKFSIKKILIIAFFIFGCLEILFAFASSYFLLLNIRAAQGLIAPAVLTGLMSYISQTAPAKSVSSAIGVYVGITIVGGFFGRLAAGFITDTFGDWRVYFATLGVVLLFASFLLCKMSADTKSNFIKPTIMDIKSVFKITKNRQIYLYIFGIMFAFQAILNFIPFELSKIDNSISNSKTAMMYFGYIFGMLISFNSRRVIKLFGSTARAFLGGAIICVLSLQFLQISNFYTIFLAMIVLCIGTFICHAVASGFINKFAKSKKAIANGLYLSFYYSGATLGSFILSPFYELGGWWLFLILLSFMVLFSIFFAFKFIHYKK